MSLITFSQLNARGRFGNQLGQRSWIKAYATEHDASWGVSPWVGEHLFGLQDPPVTEALPAFEEKCESGDVHKPLPPDGDEAIGRDYQGWCQFQTHWWTPERRVVWRDYLPTQAWMNRLRPLSDTFARAGTTIGIQIRRGDYGQGSCYDAITPIGWYLDWLRSHWLGFQTLLRPLLFVATEDRDLLDEFASYAPETVESLGVELRAEPYPLYNYLPEDVASGKAHLLDWFPEWYALTQCDILLAANSTFSLTAAMVRSAAGKPVSFWRPSWEAQGFVEEPIWNCRPLRLDCPRK